MGSVVSDLVREQVLAINRAAIRLTNYLLSFDGPFSPINAIYFHFVNRFIRR